jgi:phage/plasmid-like protein (TIGR03299 family)
MTSPLFDDTLYDPTKDQTVTGWGTQYDIAENKVQHGIDKTGGVAAFASVRAPAWHNLGVTFDHQVTAEELLVAAHADYDVLKVPDYAHHEVPVLGANGQPIMMPDASGERTPMMMTQYIEDPNVRKLIRQHPVTKQWQVLGTCGPNYQVVNNREAFLGFGDAIVDVAEPNAATCGVLFEGKQAFMCWKLPKDVLVGGVDASQLWMLVRTSHDLSTPLTGAITLLRTVCANTANWNLARAISKFTIRHTKNAKMNLQDARTALKLSYSYGDEWARIGNELVATPMMPRVFDRIITENFGPGEEPSAKAQENWDKKRDKLMTLLTQADTQANVRNTAWAGLQTIIEYCDWETKVGAKDTGLSDDGYRFWRSLDGEKSVTTPKVNALRIFADYAGVKLEA